MRLPTSRVVDLLDRGETLTSILIESGWEGDEVRRLARDRGYGFNAANGRAQRVSRPAAPLNPSPFTPPEGRTPPEPAQEPVMPEPVALRPAARDLITTGLHHDNARIRHYAGKAQAAIDKLDAILTEHEAKAEARATVERLKSELAQAQAALRGGDTKPKAAGGGGLNREIRQWAQDNGVDCPARGRIPVRVVEAYEAAVA